MIYLWILSLALLTQIVAHNEKTYSVLQIVPKNDDELRLLNDIYQNGDEKIDFWKAPTTANESVDVMTNAGFLQKLSLLLNDSGIEYRVILNDVAAFLRKSAEKGRSHRTVFGRLLRDDTSKGTNLRLGQYYSYDEIVQWMKILAQKNPRIVRLISVGTTTEGRTIYGVQIGAVHNHSAPVIFIDAGMHAREWASVHTAMYFIREFVEEYGINPKITEYIDNLDIQIFPCVNPDGYEFTRTDSSDPEIRLWRKNRSPEKCITRRDEERCCRGVDLNRNFAFHFSEIGSSFNPCSEIYHGPYAFSEPETRAIRDALLMLGTRLGAYISLHTYSQLWVYPYSHKKHSYSADYKDLQSVAKKAVETLESLYGTKYKYGTGPEIIYAYAGGSVDWAKKSAHAKYAYTIELRPSYLSWNGFILDKRQLIPTGKETYEGVKVVLDRVLSEDKQRRVSRNTDRMR